MERYHLSKCQGILESALGKNDIEQTMNMEHETSQFFFYKKLINVNVFYRGQRSNWLEISFFIIIIPPACLVIPGEEKICETTNQFGLA